MTSTTTTKNLRQELDNSNHLKGWGYTANCCYKCGKQNSDLKGLLIQCAKCKKAYYCSMGCFNADLLNHQQYCNTGKLQSQPRPATDYPEYSREKTASEPPKESLQDCKPKESRKSKTSKTKSAVGKPKKKSSIADGIVPKRKPKATKNDKEVKGESLPKKKKAVKSKEDSPVKKKSKPKAAIPIEPLEKQVKITDATPTEEGPVEEWEWDLLKKKFGRGDLPTTEREKVYWVKFKEPDFLDPPKKKKAKPVKLRESPSSPKREYGWSKPTWASERHLRKVGDAPTSPKVDDRPTDASSSKHHSGEESGKDISEYSETRKPKNSTGRSSDSDIERRLRPGVGEVSETRSIGTLKNLQKQNEASVEASPKIVETNEVETANIDDGNQRVEEIDIIEGNAMIEKDLDNVVFEAWEEEQLKLKFGRGELPSTPRERLYWLKFAEPNFLEASPRSADKEVVQLRHSPTDVSKREYKWKKPEWALQRKNRVEDSPAKDEDSPMLHSGADASKGEYKWSKPEWAKNSPLKRSAKSEIIKTGGSLAKPVTKIGDLVEKGEIGWQKPMWTQMSPLKSKRRGVGYAGGDDSFSSNMLLDGVSPAQAVGFDDSNSGEAMSNPASVNISGLRAAPNLFNSWRENSNADMKVEELAEGEDSSSSSDDAAALKSVPSRNVAGNGLSQVGEMPMNADIAAEADAKKKVSVVRVVDDDSSSSSSDDEAPPVKMDAKARVQASSAVVEEDSSSDSSGDEAEPIKAERKVAMPAPAAKKEDSSSSSSEDAVELVQVEIKESKPPPKEEDSSCSSDEEDAAVKVSKQTVIPVPVATGDDSVPRGGDGDGTGVQKKVCFSLPPKVEESSDDSDEDDGVVPAGAEAAEEEDESSSGDYESSSDGESSGEEESSSDEYESSDEDSSSGEEESSSGEYESSSEEDKDEPAKEPPKGPAVAVGTASHAAIESSSDEDSDSE